MTKKELLIKQLEELKAYMSMPDSDGALDCFNMELDQLAERHSKEWEESEEK